MRNLAILALVGCFTLSGFAEEEREMTQEELLAAYEDDEADEAYLAAQNLSDDAKSETGGGGGCGCGKGKK